MQRSSIRKFYQPDRLTMVLFVVFIILAIITAVVAFNVISNLIKGWSITSLPGAPSNNASTNSGGTISNDQPLQSSVNTTAVPWDGKSRLNILFIGLDFRLCDSTHDYESCDVCDRGYLDVHTGDAGKLQKCVSSVCSADYLRQNANSPAALAQCANKKVEQASRSDTMILLTVDPSSMTAGMLSIPRDLWVNVPGFGYYKINTAYYLGDVYHVPGFGPQLAMDTVQEFLGVPVQNYLRIDFDVFVKIVDEINGINITPDQDMSLRNKDGYPVQIQANVPVTLDGIMALAYARERKQLANGDFDRSAHQQQVIMAIRDRVLTFNMLPTLIVKAPALYNDVKNGVFTNLTFDQMFKIAQLMLQIPGENIARASLGMEQLISASSPEGLSVYLPIPDRIRLIRDQIFVGGGTTQPMAALSSNQAGNVQSEAARVAIQNATYTADLASRTATYLQQQGINIVDAANANSNSDICSIYVYNSKPYTLSYLSGLFGVSSSSIWNSYDPNAPYDFIVVLGNNWANSNPLPAQ